jgi:hypothetical protein
VYAKSPAYVEILRLKNPLSYGTASWDTALSLKACFLLALSRKAEYKIRIRLDLRDHLMHALCLCTFGILFVDEDHPIRPIHIFVCILH